MDRNDYDSPWKTILDHYFRECMEFYFPDIAGHIDWSKGYKFLDKEFQKIVKDGEIGRRYADKLVEVSLRSGEDVWVLVHVEVQGEKEDGFAKRMYTYNYRIFDRYDRKVASLGILTDSNPHWRPTCFQSELFGCRAGLEFPIVKLLDFSEEIENLEASPNPFAVVTACQLKAMASGKADDNSRFELKMGLIRRLYAIGFDRQQVIDLFAFIDWVITLPEEFENKIMYTIEQIERSENMRYVTSAEKYYTRKGIEQGIEQGMVRGVKKGVRQGEEKAMLNLITLQMSTLYRVQADSVLAMLRGLKPADLEKLAAMMVENRDQNEIVEWIRQTKNSYAN